MKLLPIALCLPLLTPADELRPAAREGDVLRKSFELETERRFSGIELRMNGEVLPVPERAGAGLSVSRRRAVVVRDTVTASAAGFATELERRFERLELAQALRAGDDGSEGSGPDGRGAGDGAVDLVARSPLAGRCAVLAAAGSGFTARWCDGSLEDAALLQGLRGPLDLAEFLPARAVAAGDTWTVPAVAWKVLHAPGGELAFAWDPAPRDEIALGSQRMEAALLDGLSGEITATYRERDGDVAVVALEGVIEARASIDLGENDAAAPFDSPAVQRQEWRFELEGELRFDLAAGRARSLELGGPLALTQTTATRLVSEDGPRELVETLRFEGEVRHSVAFEVVR